MFDPTPIARGSVSPISDNALQQIAELALAVADYETQWRESVASAPPESQDAMNKDAQRQERAVEQILEQKFVDGTPFPADLVHAFRFALHLAAARTAGVRPDEFRREDASFADKYKGARFLREQMRER